MEKMDVFFHGDSDGCCCAAIVADWLERKGKKYKLIPVDANPKFSNRSGFFLDLGGLGKEHVTEDAIVVDHHPPKDELPCKQYNPILRGESWPASYECFRVFGRPELAWIAEVGCQGDQQPISELVKISSKKYGKLDFGRIAKLIDSHRSVQGIKNMGKVVSLLLRYRENPAGFSSIKELMDSAEIIDREITRILEKPPKQEGRLVIIELKSKYQLKSQIANMANDRWPESIVLIVHPSKKDVKISLREKKEFLDFSKLLPRIVAGLEGNAGGHPKAAGGTISKKHYKVFLRRLIDETRS